MCPLVYGALPNITGTAGAERGDQFLFAVLETNHSVSSITTEIVKKKRGGTTGVLVDS